MTLYILINVALHSRLLHSNFCTRSENFFHRISSKLRFDPAVLNLNKMQNYVLVIYVFIHVQQLVFPPCVMFYNLHRTEWIIIFMSVRQQISCMMQNYWTPLTAVQVQISRLCVDICCSSWWRRYCGEPSIKLY